MSPGKLTLTYFDLRGRAELARLILAEAGAEYEDVRVSPEQWKELKPKTPFGQMPVLDVDGVSICQSFTVARFLARRFGLGGKTDVEQARADMIAESVGDIMNKYYGIWYEPEGADKEKHMAEFHAEWLPDQVKYLETLLKANGGNFLVGDGLTYADIGVGETFGNIFADKEAWKPNAPTLVALAEKVNSRPKIKQWIEKRPKTKL